jgi:hypothetical protein
MATPYPTADSFERPEYWWCMNADAKAPNEEAEKERLFIMKDSHLVMLKYIAGYVEWHDKTPIPKWCPCKIKTDNSESIIKKIRKSNQVFLDDKVIKNRFGKEEKIPTTAEIREAEVVSWDKNTQTLYLKSK